MTKLYFKKILILSGLFFCAALSAQTSGDGLWTMSTSKSAAGEKTNRASMPGDYFLAKLDLTLLKTKLLNAPAIHSGSGQPITLEFPNAQGGFEKFAVYESSIMDPILEAKFPMIKTYAAQGIDDPTATMRFSVTQFGLHSMVLSGQKSTCYIDPYTTDLINYIVYDRASLGADPQPFTCLTEDDVSLPSLQKNNAGPITVQNINDKKLRTYRLAQSCTGEYGAIFMGSGTVAQQKANVQAQMAITMNRVNGVYERDLAIHMNFIANNDLLIYMNAGTDPWTNEWNTKTAQTIDAAIGVNNYDIGHNFNTTGGGNAGCLSCVCLSATQNNSHKGRGYTGRANPTGDAFDIDYVAHEMGHQFGGYHVMNTCSRSGNGTTEVEPASGSSIMGYAGICPTNVQSNSHDDFNYVNIRDISNNIKTGNSTCGAITNLSNNPPTANAGADYIIPKSTPFILEGTASDPDGMASLTYNWSQNDPAQSPGSAAPVATYATGPMYRAISPLTSPNRYMPAIATVIANNVSSTWEVTASVTRTLNFSFIVRDNTAGGGQTASDLMRVSVNGTAGPFAVTSQPTATTWVAGTTQTITWNVAGTTASPVSTPSVNIFLSLDGGNTYPITLATNRANNGSTTITVPNNPTNTGRIMVRGAGNIFYDLNNGVIKINPASNIAPVSSFSVASGNKCTGSSIVLNDQSANTPTSWAWSATSSTGVTFSNANAQNPTVTFANAGTYTLSLIATNSIGSNTSTQVLTINATPAVSVNSASICTGESVVLAASGASSYQWSNTATTSSITVSPTATTSYTVTGTSNSCSAAQVAIVHVDLCTSMDELSSNEFVIYPNPTSGIFSIELDKNTGKVNLEIFDAIGKLVIQKTDVVSGTAISLESFAKGIYTVRISHEGTYKVIRVIKQ
jgi:PKD repeat protein